MPATKCRVCNHKFFAEPLLRYANMPRSAQYLPDTGDLRNDTGVDLEVCQCSGCGLAQLSNDPVPYHREVIRAAAFSDEMKNFRKKQFSGFLEKSSLKGRKVVEIGCGRGEYLTIMQQAGAEAYGLEFSEEAVKHCVCNGLKVSKGYIQHKTDRLTHAPFDGFYILNFLEHLPEPGSVLGGLHCNLAESAVGLVEVPNFDMILKKNLFSEFVVDHLFYFTRATLNTVLMLNGFEIVDCREVWHDYIISAVVKKGRLTATRPGPGLPGAEKLDLSHFYRSQERLKREVEEYVNRFQDGKVAIWGAGHQALALISMLNLAGRIRYVVDSATFKQGRYTPATHVRILSPDALASDPVEAVIVMAASYSEEVAGNIRKKFGAKMDVSVLRDSGLEVV